MRVLIRTDSSTQIGTGHVMRCLTLAESLKEKGCEITFICRELPGNIISIIIENGFEVLTLPYNSKMIKENYDNEYKQWLVVSQKTDLADCIELITKKDHFDWCIIDHYGLNKEWESGIRNYCRKVMVIDDLANREHDCDIILDQNIYENFEKRYDNLVPVNCTKFLGAEYALLRKEFIRARRNLKICDGQIKRILIFFGGIDNTAETMKAVKALDSLGLDHINVDVVLGASNKNKDEIVAYCEDKINFNTHCQISNIAELMADADLALGAGGTTTYERYCLGLPTILIAVAENQVEAAQIAAKYGYNYFLGQSSEVTEVNIGEFVTYLLTQPEVIIENNAMILRLLDGKGCDKITCEILKGL